MSPEEAKRAVEEIVARARAQASADPVCRGHESAYVVGVLMAELELAMQQTRRPRKAA